MSGYAEGTSVPVAKSRAELEAILTRYGAERFGSMTENERALVLFEVKGRRVVFVLPLPKFDDFKTKKTRPGGGYFVKTVNLTPEQQAKAYEQGCREKWRALVLVVKAKLEAVRSGITTFEDEFAMHFVMPDGRRLRDTLLPALETTLSSGKLPPLLGLPAPEAP